MVQEGLGIAIWPKYSWRSHLLNETELTDVCFREIDKNEFRRSLYLIVQKDLKMTEELGEILQIHGRIFWFSKRYVNKM